VPRPQLGKCYRQKATPLGKVIQPARRPAEIAAGKNETVILVIYGCFWLFFQPIFSLRYSASVPCSTKCRNTAFSVILDKNPAFPPVPAGRIASAFAKDDSSDRLFGIPHKGAN
jgi:hypothetical protein